MNELWEESYVTMEDLVMENFNSQTDDKNKLALLNNNGLKLLSRILSRMMIRRHSSML
jgi:hypothetical protein